MAVLETPRLILRKPRLSDAAAIFVRYARDREVTRYLSWAPHASVRETEAFLAAHLDRMRAGGLISFIVERRAECDVIGMIDVRLDGPEAEIGYGYARDVWGRGYATEALNTVAAYAFQHLHVERVIAYCSAANRASARVMEKAGLRYVGPGRTTVYPALRSEHQPTLLYALSRREWYEQTSASRRVSKERHG